MTSETSRILNIPVDDRDGTTLVESWTARLRAPGGTWDLLPQQALSIEYAASDDARGLFLPVTVGGGKTLLGALLGTVMGYEPHEVVVLCRPNLIAEAARELELYHEQFVFEDPVYLSYKILSDTDSGSLLWQLAPKLIIADEAHALKHPRAARTNRFVKYMRMRRDVRFVAMSATFTNASVQEYAHLAYLALGDYSPLPIVWPTLESWSRVVDVNPKQPPTKQDWHSLMPLIEKFGPNDDEDLPLYKQARHAFGERLRLTPGVVVTDGDSYDGEIEVADWLPVVPSGITDAMDLLKDEGVLPNGTIVEDPPSKLLQLSQGFYYFPDWPGEPDLEWLYAKREWEQQLRAFKAKGKLGLDSDALIRRALIAGDERIQKYLSLRVAWEQWQEHAHKAPPPQGVEWISTSILEQALEFAETNGPMLIWGSYGAVFDKFEELGAYVTPKAERPAAGALAVVSSYSHSTGLNLQHDWANNLVMAPSSNGGLWQQLMGRTARLGQKADVVRFWVGQHTGELRAAFKTAKKKAEYIQSTQQLQQKLLSARYV